MYYNFIFIFPLHRELNYYRVANITFIVSPILKQFLHQITYMSSVEEWIRRLIHRQGIAGSNPPWGEFFLFFIFFHWGRFPRLISSLASISQHFQLSWNVNNNALHHSKPKSHCLLLLKGSKCRSFVFLHYDLKFFWKWRADFGFSPKSKKIFLSFFFLNSCINLQVRPITIDLC